MTQNVCSALQKIQNRRDVENGREMAGTTSRAHRDEIHHICETLLKTSNTSATRSPTTRPIGRSPTVRGMAPKKTEHGMMTCHDALVRRDRGTGHGKRARQGLSRDSPERHYRGGPPRRGGKRRWARGVQRGSGRIQAGRGGERNGRGKMGARAWVPVPQVCCDGASI
jgi:hypothetical protein